MNTKSGRLFATIGGIKSWGYRITLRTNIFAEARVSRPTYQEFAPFRINIRNVMKIYVYVYIGREFTVNH